MGIVFCSIANEMGYCHIHQDASENATYRRSFTPRPTPIYHNAESQYPHFPAPFALYGAV
jgi:hypothetical protein